jgi:hypothetical protein
LFRAAVPVGPDLARRARREILLFCVSRPVAPPKRIACDINAEGPKEGRVLAAPKKLRQIAAAWIVNLLKGKTNSPAD